MIDNSLTSKNRILEIITGSHLYGTATPSSDTDYVGVFMPSIEYVLGLKSVDELDLSVSDKDDKGKNTKNSIDRKLYEFRKFIKLALENNPNIIEILFVNIDNIIYITDVGKTLLDIRHNFLHRGLSKKFIGYAISQRHKMVIKKDNYFELKSALEYLLMIDSNKYICEVPVNTFAGFKTIYDEHNNCKFIQIGDLNILPSKYVRSVICMIEDRLSKVGNREDLVMQHGYDTKFASHLIRLLLEGKELLTTGDLQFPLNDRQLISDIRNGKWQIEKIISFSDELQKEINSIILTSKLPEKPNTQYIEQYMITELKKIISV